MTHTECMQEDCSMPPVLIREDVTRKFMESWKRKRQIIRLLETFSSQEKYINYMSQMLR